MDALLHLAHAYPAVVFVAGFVVGAIANELSHWR